MEHTFSLTMNPSFGIFSSTKQFVYLERRIGQIGKYMVDATIKHIEYLDKFKTDNNLKGYMQLRRIFYDDKHGSFECIVDYLTDKSIESRPNFSFEHDFQIIKGQFTSIDLKIIDCMTGSDHFDKNHRDYYMTDRVVPMTSDFYKYYLQTFLKK